MSDEITNRNRIWLAAIEEGAFARREGKQLSANPHDPDADPVRWKGWGDGWATEGERMLLDQMVGGNVVSLPLDGPDADRPSSLGPRTGWDGEVTRLRLRFPVADIDPNTDVIRTWDIILQIADSGLRWCNEGRAGRPSFPLHHLLAPDPPEDTLSREEEAALKVAASTLRRYCALGLVRCGYVEKEAPEYSEDGEILYDVKAWVIDSREFEHIEFQWDGSLFSEDVFYFPEDVFIVGADVERVVGKGAPRSTAPANTCLKMTDFDRPRRGPQAKFKEDEFWAVVACLADLDSLPDTQAEFLRKIDEALMAEWEGTPGETWIKKRASVLYRVRSQFRKGNRDRNSGQ